MIAILLGFALIFTSLYSASVDLWTQVALHFGLLLGFVWMLFSHTELPLPHYLCKPRPFALLLLISVALAGSLVASGTPWKSLESLWLWCDVLFLLILTPQLSRSSAESILKGIPQYGLLLSLWALYQTFVLHTAPVAGLWNRNELGSYLLVPFFLSLPGTLARKPLSVLCTTLITVALLCTRSVGVWVALGVGGFYLSEHASLPRKSIWRALSALTCVVPLAYRILNQGDPHRFQLWGETLRMIRWAPWFGLGPGSFAVALPHPPGMDQFSLYAHNAYLQWAVEYGLVFTVALMTFIALLWKEQKNRYIQAAIIALLFHNLLDYSLLLPAHLLLLFVLLSIRTTEAPSDSYAFSLTFPEKALGVTLALSLGMLIQTHFMSDRLRTQGEYAFSQNKIEDSASYANRSIHIAPEHTPAFTLLSSIRLQQASIHPTPAALAEAVSYLVIATDMEPLNQGTWYRLFQVAPSWNPTLAVDLKSQLFLQYPHLRRDRHFMESQ